MTDFDAEVETARPAGPQAPQAATEDERLILNPFLRVRIGDPLVCDLLLDGESVEIRTPAVLSVLFGCPQARTRDDVAAALQETLGCAAAEAAQTVQDLIALKLLVAPDHRADMLPGAAHWDRRGWLDALVFHLSSRNVAYADVGPAAQSATSHDTMSAYLDADGPPEIWKDLSGHPLVELPDPRPAPGDQTLEDVLLRRRTGGGWRKESLDPAVLAAVLAAGNAENLRLRDMVADMYAAHPESLMRSAYSALETYVCVFDVAGCAPGLYAYDLRARGLRSLRLGDFRDTVQTICIGQRSPAEASATLIITAVWARYMFRYRHPRAYRNLMVNVGELAHRYILAATAHRLGNFLTPALQDEVAADFLAVDPAEEAPIYTVAIG